MPPSALGLQIFHTGSNSYIKDSGTGVLVVQGSGGVYVQGANGTDMIRANEGSAVNLYHNDILKLATVTGGVSVTGTVTATSYAGDGSALTGVAGTPAGAVIYHAANAPPTGFIKANGASLSTTTYADLFAVIGYTFGGSGSSFNVPDLRGEFMRGWDDSRGIDGSRAFGSAQADELKSHNHALLTYTNGFNGTRFATFTNTAGATRYTENTGGSETRPRNIALLACIKY